MNLKKNIVSIALIVVGGVVCLFHLGINTRVFNSGSFGISEGRRGVII